MLLWLDCEHILAILLIIILVLQPWLRTKKLVPEDSLEWRPWLQQGVQCSQACTLRVKNAQDKYETISFLSLYLMGYSLNSQAGSNH